MIENGTTFIERSLAGTILTSLAEYSNQLFNINSNNNIKITADGRDQVMENLQKLFDAHRRGNSDQQQPQPGCSTNSTTGVNNGIGESGTGRSGPDDHNDDDNNSQMNLHSTFPSDLKFSSLKSTLVADQLLACFVIGGECRLCFEQMRALCLGDIPTQRIDETLKSLAIMNAYASEEQLNVLKRGGIVPVRAAKCELITKTNAERLISLLKFNGIPRLESILLQSRALRVAHDCFGGCSALLYAQLAPDPCLECCTCHFMFKPEDFCRHTHKPAAIKEVCFWGFDASNWACYLRVDDDDSVDAGTPGNIGIEEAERQLVRFIESYRNSQAHSLWDNP